MKFRKAKVIRSIIIPAALLMAAPSFSHAMTCTAILSDQKVETVELSPDRITAQNILESQGAPEAIAFLNGKISKLIASNNFSGIEPQELSYLATLYFKNNDKPNNVRTLLTYLEKIPFNKNPGLYSRALGNLALAYEQLHETTENKEFLDKAIAVREVQVTIDPENFRAVRSLISIFISSDRPEDALKHTDKLSELTLKNGAHKVHIESVLTHAQLLRDQKQDLKAEKVLLELLKHERYKEQGLIALAKFKASKRAFQEAEDYALELLKIANKPSSIRVANLVLGGAYMGTQRWEEAVSLAVEKKEEAALNGRENDEFKFKELEEGARRGLEGDSSTIWRNY